jgi:hypothetical protein
VASTLFLIADLSSPRSQRVRLLFLIVALSCNALRAVTEGYTDKLYHTRAKCRPLSGQRRRHVDLFSFPLAVNRRCRGSDLVGAHPRGATSGVSIGSGLKHLSVCARTVGTSTASRGGACLCEFSATHIHPVENPNISTRLPVQRYSSS